MIILNINPTWIEKDIEDIATRVAAIVSGRPEIQRTATFSWSIDIPGNNWWFTWEGNTIKITRRYVNDPNDTTTQAVRTLLLDFCGLDQYNFEIREAVSQ